MTELFRPLTLWVMEWLTELLSTLWIVDLILDLLVNIVGILLIVGLYGTFDYKWKEHFGWKSYKQISDWIWFVIVLGFVYLFYLFWIYAPDPF